MVVVRRFRATAALLLAAYAAAAMRGAPGEPRNDFRFSILGDRTGGARPGVYEQAWREVDQLRPDFVIHVGDLIEGGEDLRAEAEWERLRPLWERYGRYPLHFTPGNHDIWSEWSEQIYRERTGRPPSYSFDYQDAHFTILDNSRTLDLADDQLAFLEADLKAHAHRRPKFVFLHKPYWIVFLKVGSGAFPLHQLARRYGVQFVVSGHSHQWGRIERDGITYLQAGSSGGHLRQGGGRDAFRQGWFFQHGFVRVAGSRVEITVKELDPPFGRGRRFSAADWDASGPRFDPETLPGAP